MPLPDATPSLPPPLPAATADGSPVLLVSGLSGAGKSTALQVLEDVGFFTADGLPPGMIPEFYNLLQKPGMDHFRGMALGVDFQRGATVDDLDAALNTVRGAGGRPALLFLEADPPAILRRYATTRRPHPLEKEGMGLERALDEESRRLAPVRAAADWVIDTSTFSLHDLRHEMQRRWGQEPARAHAMRVRILSFGFKYGAPSEADLVFDARFLPNPYFVPELRPLSGQDSAVADYVFAGDPARRFREKFLRFLLYLLPLYDEEGRYRLALAIGCTGGRHRSVALAEYAARALRQAGYAVTVEHRHLALDGAG